MRVSNIFLLGLTFICDALLHLATAQKASFSEAEWAALEAEIAQEYMVFVKDNAKGKRVLRKLKNGKFACVELAYPKISFFNELVTVKFDNDEAESAFRKAATMSGIERISQSELICCFFCAHSTD